MLVISTRESYFHPSAQCRHCVACRFRRAALRRHRAPVVVLHLAVVVPPVVVLPLAVAVPPIAVVMPPVAIVVPPIILLPLAVVVPPVVVPCIAVVVPRRRIAHRHHRTVYPPAAPCRRHVARCRRCAAHCRRRAARCCAAPCCCHAACHHWRILKQNYFIKIIFL